MDTAFHRSRSFLGSPEMRVPCLLSVGTGAFALLTLAAVPETLRNYLEIALPAIALFLLWIGWFLLHGGKLRWALGKGFTVLFAAAITVLVVLSIVHYGPTLAPLPVAVLFCVAALIFGLFRLNREVIATRESEERFRLLVDGVQDYAIFALSPKGGIVSWNAGAERLKGYHAAEIIGKHFSRFYLPEDIANRLPEKELAEAAEKGQIVTEGLRVRKDGSQFWAGITITALRDTSGNLRGFSKITRDVTPRKHTEEVRQEANRKAIAELTESINDGFLAFDRNWRCLRVNPAATRLLHKSQKELLGYVIWDAFPATTKLMFGKELRRAMEENVAIQFEEFYPNPLNVWFDVRAYPSADGLNVFFIDITERKATEQRLRQLSRAVEQSPASVVITDLMGNIEYVNPKFTEVTGYSYEEIIGQNPRILKSGEIPPEAYAELWETVLAGREWRGEFHNRKKNGELYWEAASICSIADETGRLTHLLAVKEDITARKNAEAALVEAKQSAEQANQAKDIFLATLSHELRTPLTPVLLASSFMESDESLPTDLRTQFGMIRTNIELEAHLIDDLLDITKIAHGKFSVRLQTVNASELLSRTLEIVRSDYLEKQIRIEFDQTARFANVCADPARLQQVFWNILKNAIKFTPSGGNIYVRTLNPDAQNVAIEIQDTGIGISKEFINDVFLPFQQGATSGKPQYGGLGLGLSISKTIVEVLGGSIMAASDGPKSGTTFTVRLPICEMKVETKGGEIVPEKRDVYRRILLVEDHEPTRTMLARLLHKDGHQVQVAGSCEEAINIARSQPATEPFQSLICDLGLPDGSGLDLVPKLKVLIPDLATIALSGFGTDDDIRHSREAGFAAHLVKPVSIQELRRILET